MSSKIFPFFCFLVWLAVVSADCDYYGDNDCPTDTPEVTCGPNNCKLPNCSCFAVQPNIPYHKRPQLVMLTFDDAVTVANIETYRDIIRGRKNRNGQNIKLTFFVCHEYNNYNLTRELYSGGHEIAVHSISHESDTDVWRHAEYIKWKQEMIGMRLMLGTFGFVPQREIVGHRAPFLQTAGDATFEMLKKEGFLYDSSMPTRNYIDPPIWPYTLDYGYSPQDCQIDPCPKESYPGVWEIPMVQYELKSKDGIFHCSMADACTPLPTTVSETVDYLMSNFNRHYRTNKAPFPLFMHEAWLKDPERLEGYKKFLDQILEKEDVFVVTVRDVIEYVQNPVEFQNYRSRSQAPVKDCKEPKACSYKEPLRIMTSCAPCPPYYPWVGTPLGKKKPVFPDPDEDD